MKTAMKVKLESDEHCFFFPNETCYAQVLQLKVNHSSPSGRIISVSSYEVPNHRLAISLIQSFCIYFIVSLSGRALPFFNFKVSLLVCGQNVFLSVTSFQIKTTQVTPVHSITILSSPRQPSA